MKHSPSPTSPQRGEARELKILTTSHMRSMFYYNNKKKVKIYEYQFSLPSLGGVGGGSKNNQRVPIP